MKTPSTDVWRQMQAAGAVRVMDMVCAVDDCRRYLGSVLIVDRKEYVYTEFAWSDAERSASTHHMVKDAATEATGQLLEPSATTITQCPHCGDGGERNARLLAEARRGTKVLAIPPHAVLYG